MLDIHNFEQYSPHALKIKTKIHGLQPFKLRKYQLKFLKHLKEDYPSGIIRSISLKPRQAGWSTLIAGINIHKTATRFNERGIMMADKFTRTQEVHGIYSTFVDNIPAQLKPMVLTKNSEEIYFDSQKPGEGLGSGFISETAQDKNAGRSGTRMWAHLTEHAFYPYALEVDEGIQNSIPLAKGTRIFKESTANGMSGNGEAFYLLWEAANRGDTIYKPFFVPWYDIDDYQLEVPRGTIFTAEEIALIKLCPGITNENLIWRRLKISEYSKTSESFFSPSDRFKQDFPSYPEEAFLNSGMPVFDQERIKKNLIFLREHVPPQIKIRFTSPTLKMFPDLLTVFFAPEKGRKYFIGADVAEGLELGDASSACIIDDNHRQVAFFHGRIDPDLFGKALVEIAKVYNDALIAPEINSMGHTTLTAIKEKGYLKVYMRAIEDQIEGQLETKKMGWRTTAQSKQKMLNKLISSYRDGDIKILDLGLLNEMLGITRESDGDVVLNGKDKTVAACLALMATTQEHEPARVTDPNKKEKLIFETKDKSRYAIMKKEAKKWK